MFSVTELHKQPPPNRRLMKSRLVQQNAERCGSFVIMLSMQPEPGVHFLFVSVVCEWKAGCIVDFDKETELRREVRSKWRNLESS